MRQYEGHRSLAAWNVYIWLTNDETLYGACKFSINQAMERRSKLKSEFLKRRKLAPLAAEILLALIPERTPDGHRYTRLNVAKAIDSIMEDLGVSA